MSNLSFFRKSALLLYANKDAVFCLSCRAKSIMSHSNAVMHVMLEKHRVSLLNKDREPTDLTEPIKKYRNSDVAMVNEYREKFPEFLPNPDWKYRDRLGEKLERLEMYRRRKNIDIPEFYVGSIMAVTVSDKYAPGKSNRFVGICIHREGHGLKHTFILRNVIDNQGVEIMYEMYNPLLQSIEVLCLEKRLDKELFYLRDCPLEYSYFPQDFEQQMIHEGMDVPVNNIKVTLGPRPWTQRWWRMDLKGVHKVDPYRSEKARIKGKKKDEHPQLKKVWEKDDIMKHYRESINYVESAEIYKEMQKESKDWKRKS
ncbi:large ribosomal subunit protein bL19m-like isoform X2 [Ruditapes philippinarum]|uniref:large ribosomal subunit protein bL19m-like isoform X1 n=1 Tax=Ruditapes philippinarum TaxID=129788 RepID=UPI00295BE6D4|nr:large ribosomal subunit protein bL19m-like isoform X1 [Ruditapes philippinarum]XP_060602635.1 large ribosomal subunit protein bL19m-like isoform X2 [Ruditapes philippinarum]